MKAMAFASRLVLAALVLVGCGADGAGQAGSDVPGRASSAEAPAPDLESANRLGVRNARMPEAGLLAEAGYESFISARRPGEDGAGLEEAHSVDRGLDVRRCPVAGADRLTRENVEALPSLLESTGGAPTVVYCGRSKRVEAMMALKAHWIDGVAPARAYETGIDSGLAGLSAPV